MARFFIDRPVFAIVIAIVIVILGSVAIPNLPIETYPQVVPPVVQIIAAYRGGNAEDLEKTVAQPIEQQLVGLDGMLYFFSRSSNDGVLTIDVTYQLGTDIDMATVRTQNKVNLALPSLPPEVQRVGVTVKKVSSAFLFAVGIKDHLHYMNTFDGNNWSGWSGWSALPGGGTTKLPDAAVVYHDKLYLFGIGTDNHHYVNSTSDGQNWSGWSGLPGGGTTKLSDAAAVFQDKLYLFGIGNDQRHYVNTSSGISLLPDLSARPNHSIDQTKKVAHWGFDIDNNGAADANGPFFVSFGVTYIATSTGTTISAFKHAAVPAGVVIKPGSSYSVTGVLDSELFFCDRKYWVEIIVDDNNQVKESNKNNNKFDDKNVCILPP